MRKRTKIAVATLLLGIVGVIAWEVLREREPVYQGKHLTAWLAEAADYQDDHSRWPENRPEAMKAVQEIGTNAIPALITMLKAEDSDSPMTRAGRWLEQHHLPHGERRPAWLLNMRAVFGFSALGTNANSAVPALVQLHLQRRRYVTALALISVGSKGLRALSQILTNQSLDMPSPGHDLRHETIAAWINVYVAPLRAYGDSPLRPAIRKEAKEAIRIIAPALIQCLGDPNLSVRVLAADALVYLDIERDKAVSALAGSLSNSESAVWELASADFRKVGSAAFSAIPASVLQAGSTNPDPCIRAAASNLLAEVARVAAAKAGVNTNGPGN